MLSPTTRRNLLIAILVLLLLLIALVAWWFLRSEPEVPVATPPVVEQTLPSADRETISDVQQKEEREERANTASIQSASKTFSERYGSYSTEAEFANLRDVLPLMSAAFAAKTQAFIDGATPSAAYYGVTTRAVTIRVNATDEAAGTADVTVTTQREEAKDVPQNVSVRYQDLELTFIMEDGEWKVDSAVWK